MSYNYRIPYKGPLRHDPDAFADWLLGKEFVELPSEFNGIFGRLGCNRIFVNTQKKIYVTFDLDTGKGNPPFYYFWLNTYSLGERIPTKTAYSNETSEDIKSQIRRYIHGPESVLCIKNIF